MADKRNLREILDRIDTRAGRWFNFTVYVFIIAMLYAEDSPMLENNLHKTFSEHQVNKVNPRKEFFRTSLSDIKVAVEDMGIESHWTLAAEAQEYRDSLAIEKQYKTASQNG